MAHHVEPMDIDSMDSDFDNKENTFHHSNVLPCTEKGYEELDVSELNMKLRYSITPASSPMSKSYTAHYHDNRNSEVSDDSLNSTVSDNLTRSLNSTMIKNDSVIKSLKTLPLQMLPTDQYTDSNRNLSVLRQVDSTVTADDNVNVTVVISGTNDDENVSLASSSSSTPHTPEATTPIKDVPKDGGSPIMRGLKSVLNMFRSSQSPVPPEVDNGNFKHEIHHPETRSSKYDHEDNNASQALIASTPIAAHRNRDTVSKRSSPYKDSIVFNDDLEKELQWTDETTILLSQEKVPIQNLLVQETSLSLDCKSNDLNTTRVKEEPIKQDNLNNTLEYMDISYNVSTTDRTMTEIQLNKNELTATESDSEFLDCETTFSKNDSQSLDNGDIDNVAIPNVGVTQNMTTINSTFDVPANSTGMKEEIIMETKEGPLDIPNQSNIITELGEIDKSTISIHLGVTNEDKMHIITNDEVTRSDSKVTEQNQDQNITYENEPVVISTMPGSSEPILPKAIKESLDVTITNEITVNNQAKINIHKNDHKLIKLNSELEPDSLEYNEVKDITNVQAIFETNAKPVIAPIIENPEELQNAVHHSVELSDVNATLCDIPTTELPADVPLPDEDDIGKELDITVDCLHLDKNIFNITQDLPEEGNTESIKLDEKLDKSLKNLLSEKRTENIGNALLNVTAELSNVQNYSNQIYQNMSLDSIQLLNDIKNFVECDSATSAKLVEQIETELNAFQTMDINESVYNIHTLSAVPNETIPLSCSENLEQNINEIECVEMKTQSHSSFDSVAKTEPENESVVDIMNTTVGIIIDEKNLDDVSKVYIVTNEIENTVLPEIDDKDLDIHLSSKDVTIDKITEVIETLTDECFVPKSIEVDNVESKNKSTILPENDAMENISQQNNKNITGPNSEITDTFNEERIYVVPNTVTIDKNVIIQDAIQVNDILPIEQCIDSIIDKEVIHDEEIIVSANTSPFVSMSTGINLLEPKLELNLEGIENSLVPEDKIANAPPTSPAIVSKGYNFNFDEMDDPFDTKSNIRMSPNKIDFIGENADKIFEPPKRDMNKNRRKSQPERKKPGLAKNKFNATFDGPVKGPVKIVDNQEISPEMEIENIVNMGVDIDSIKCQGVSNESITEIRNYELVKPEIHRIDDPKIIKDKLNDIADTIMDKTRNENKNKCIDLNCSQEEKCSTQSKTIVENEIKNTSSSEQSTYYSVSTSSNESIPSRNVFNLPEIDDMNFNPFATKTKMRQFPSPMLAMDDPFATKSKMRQSPPSNLEIDDPFATKSKMKFTPDSSMINYGNVHDHDANTTIILNEPEKPVPSPNDNTDKMETEKMEKETSGNISNTSLLSKVADDRDSTVIEVHTEDEDTEEGPFLEADDLHNLDKMSDSDGDNVDMMKLNEFPTQSNDDNLTGEMFIDAEAFEFLLNQNKTNIVADSGKESLFLKFDPLFAKRISSDGVLTALSKVQRKQQSTPIKVTNEHNMNITLEKSPTAGPSNFNITYEQDASKINNHSSEDINVTISKPMMVVTPAVNPVVTPRNKSLTPTRTNRHSITFTSPAMAVIDRLLSMSANNSLVSHDTTITHATREQNEADLALTQLRELLAEKEIHVYSLRSESKEMKDRLMSLESQMKTLESESQQRLTNINELNGRLSEKTKVNRSMAAVVEEYERTIASLIAEKEQDIKQHAEERMQLIKERDEQTAHLASMEVSFSDLHSKYEKSKQIILSCKASEDTYKKSIKACVENFNKMQNNYELLKQHATTKLNHANQEMEKSNRAHDAEVLKLNAMIKRKDLHITSLEETLTQKTKANEELTAICDELLNKVG